MPQKGFLNIHLLVALLCAIAVGLFAVVFFCSPRAATEETILPSQRQALADCSVSGKDCFVIDDPLVTAPVDLRPLSKKETGEVTAAARTDGRIRARVVDTHTGRPIAAFKVWVSKDGGQLADGGWTSRPGEFVRNDFGIVELDNIDAGTWTLLIRCPGYKDLLVPDLAVPQERELLTLSLSRGTHICGTVIDSHGKPVPKARVIVKSLSGGRTGFDSDRTGPESGLVYKKMTNSDGFYLVGGLTAGAYDVFLESTDDPSDCRRGLFVAEGGGLTIDLSLPVRNRIEFRIGSAAGGPLKKASVRLYAEGRRFNATTDGEGRAVMERIPPGAYTLSVVKGGFYPLKEEFSLETLEGTHAVNKKLKAAPRNDH